jgi:hypothetical protein
MIHKVLYVKINKTSIGPSPYDNSKWFFSSAADILEIDLSCSNLNTSESALDKISKNITDHKFLIFGAIPYPILNFRDWGKLRTTYHLKIGLMVADTIQFFPNYYEYYTHLIDFAICIGEDDCNYFENSRIPSYHSYLLYDNCNIFLDHCNELIPTSKRTTDIIHIGRTDCGSRALYLDSISKLNLKSKFFGKKVRNSAFTPLDEIISTAKNTKIAICFSQPNHERSFNSSNSLWEFKVQNKGTLLQLLAAGCVVIAEYQPYLFKHYKPGENILLLEKDYKSQILKLLNNPEYLDRIQENARKLINIKFDIQIQIGKFRNFLDCVSEVELKTPSVDYDFYIDRTYKHNFIRFNRSLLKSSIYRKKIVDTGTFSYAFIYYSLFIYLFKKFIIKLSVCYRVI